MQFGVDFFIAKVIERDHCFLNFQFLTIKIFVTKSQIRILLEGKIPEFKGCSFDLYLAP